jgi:hypothetical protein
VKRRPRPMLGLKSYGHAAITIAGVELLHRIRNNQLTPETRQRVRAPRKRVSSPAIVLAGDLNEARHLGSAVRVPDREAADAVRLRGPPDAPRHPAAECFGSAGYGEER